MWGATLTIDSNLIISARSLSTFSGVMILCLRISPKSALFRPKKRESVAKRHSGSNPIRSASQSFAFYSPGHIGLKPRFSHG
jgi:hypothetical protein